MKKILLLILLSFSVYFAKAQDIVRFETEASAFRFYNKNLGEWMSWSEWEEEYLLIVFDTNRKRITINSVNPRELVYYDSEELSDGSFKLYCIDKDGVKCYLRIVYFEGYNHLYIDYRNAQFVYIINVKK